jgi:hypothetical protein
VTDPSCPTSGICLLLFQAGSIHRLCLLFHHPSPLSPSLQVMLSCGLPLHPPTQPIESTHRRRWAEHKITGNCWIVRWQPGDQNCPSPSVFTVNRAIPLLCLEAVSDDTAAQSLAHGKQFLCITGSPVQFLPL